MVLIMCTFTCENVIDVFFFFFFDANIREDTSSLALEHNGVIINDR